MFFSVMVRSAKSVAFHQKCSYFDQKDRASLVLFRYKCGTQKNDQGGLARLKPVVLQGLWQPAVSLECLQDREPTEKAAGALWGGATLRNQVDKSSMLELSSLSLLVLCGRIVSALVLLLFICLLYGTI